MYYCPKHVDHRRRKIKLNKSWHQVGLLFFNYHNDARSNAHKIYPKITTPYCTTRWNIVVFDCMYSTQKFFVIEQTQRGCRTAEFQFSDSVHNCENFLVHLLKLSFFCFAAGLEHELQKEEREYFYKNQQLNIQRECTRFSNHTHPTTV